MGLVAGRIMERGEEPGTWTHVGWDGWRFLYAEYDSESNGYRYGKVTVRSADGTLVDEARVLDGVEAGQVLDKHGMQW